jgi:hypothetical protein
MGLAGTIVVALPFPLYVSLSSQASGVLLMLPTALFYFIMGYGALTVCFPTSIALVNKAADQEYIGRVNGIANSLYSLARGVIPFLCGLVTELGAAFGI